MAQPDYGDIVRRNARRWEAMAKHRPGMPLAEHRAGVSAMVPEELELVGDLRGKRVLHLACSVSDEGITMARHGASVVGVDASPTHVRVGQEKADSLGADVNLRVGDMMNLDDDLREFDLVYIGGGGICWVPDLDDWLIGVRNALNPNGRLFLAEHHPIWETLGATGERQLTVLHDYFGKQDLPAIVDPAKAAIGVAETAQQGSHEPLHSFLWGIGDVVSALITNDFQIAALKEIPDPPMFRGLGIAADCVPAVYLLKARRR